MRLERQLFKIVFKSWLPVVGIISLMLLLACQQKPTLGVTESGVLVQNQDYRKVILENSVVFDTRSPFDFNTTKVPGSINLIPADFHVSLNPLDAARRLSLYGVNPDSTVVIIGDGNGDEQKLAWEFIKLGIIRIEILRATVFRLMNLKPEPPKENVSLWKPESAHGEMTIKNFEKKINELRPGFVSRARAQIFQGFPADKALRKSVLIVSEKKDDKHTFADHLVLPSDPLYDDEGLLNRSALQELKIEVDLKKYDVVFLVDLTNQAESRAYALVQFGAKSLFIVR